jgi:serine/threonine protein kinase
VHNGVRSFKWLKFREWMLHSPLFPAKKEQELLDMMSDLLGNPTPKIWPGIMHLPFTRYMNFKEQPYNTLKAKFPSASEATMELLNGFLTYDNKKRFDVVRALEHEYFKEKPYSCRASDIRIPEVQD